MSAPRHRYSDKEWDLRKETIRRLYIDEDASLAQVQTRLRDFEFPVT